MQTHVTRPTGPFRLATIPLGVRTFYAQVAARREDDPFAKLEIIVAARAPSERVYVLTGERV